MKIEGVSIIVPIHNTKERYLKECIESLIKQTFSDFEIILVDDGSNYETAKICDDYSNKDKRIKVIHQDNQGVSVARNEGIKNSKEKWVAFVDADDWAEPDMVERMLFYAKKDEGNADIVIFANYVDYKNKEKRLKKFNKNGKLNSKDIEELEIQIVDKGNKSKYEQLNDITSPWGKIFRKKFLIDNNIEFPKNMIKTQDGVFNIYVLEKASSIFYYSEYIYHYRYCNKSITHRFLDRNLITYNERNIYELNKFMLKYNKGEKYKEALQTKVLRLINTYLKEYFSSINNTRGYWKLKKEFYDLINSNIYANAIQNSKNLKISFKEKLILILIKNRMFCILYIIDRLRNKIETNKKLIGYE